jgi:methionine-rich copper-binding protein CopC
VVPQNPAAADTSSVELGVKFKSDIDGEISGVRFYKGPGNTGTHVGSLWTATGTLLASATFAGESASGWQEVTFSNPVPISANTTYVAAYLAPSGHYAADARSFDSGPVDNPPLHALASSTSPNGVYGYSASSSFPTNSFLAANYFVDPVFTAQSVDTTAPSVAVKSPTPGATGVSTLATPKATYTEPVQPATVSFVLTKPGNITVPASLSYDAATRTSRLAPQSPLATSTTYTATVSGATDLAGNVMSAPVTWSFTTSATAPPPLISIWDSSATPANPSVDDPNAVELGVKFQSDISGAVTGVRFYKGAANAGTHTGNLWTADGTLLSSVVFTNETASGWQEMSFPSPVTIAADTTYIVSYYAPAGHYAADGSYFAASGVDNAPLHGLADSVSPNGVFHYSSSGFPSSSFNASNYWVDVVFATGAGDNTPPTVASTVPTANAVAVASGSTVAATFSEAVQAATVTFTLTGPGGAVPATVSYDSPDDRSILTPTAPLSGGVTYTAHVSGAKDTAGNQMSGTTTWSFTTADTTPPTVSSTAPAAGATNVAVNATVTANYSEAVQPATVAFTLTDPASNNVPATGTYDVANQRSVLTPTAPLAGSTVYTATVSGAQDAAGNAMTAPTTWSFTTVDNTPPVISSINAVPGSTTATITWVTNEAATTRVDYGTSPSSLTLQVTSATPVTLHAINLTGLGAHTTYYYRVTSLDAATNSATAPASPAAPATFTTNFATIADTTSANFSAGTPGSATYVAQTADGEVILAPAGGSEFGGTSLPSTWASSVLAAGGSATVTGGSLVVDGAWARTNATFTPGRSLEFVATFTTTANQSVGIGNTLNESPWAMFSTRAGGALRISTRNGTTPIEVSLGTTYLGAPHLYRIDWSAASIVYSVDGVVVGTQNTAVPTGQRAVVRDNTPGGNAMVVNWLRLTPYAATGTFTSRVLDGGASVLWDSASWTTGLPPGTSAVVKVRTGNSATPNASWSGYTTVGSGQSINVRSRYIQYQVVLSTSATSQTPAFQDITVRYGA